MRTSGGSRQARSTLGRAAFGCREANDRRSGTLSAHAVPKTLQLTVVSAQLFWFCTGVELKLIRDPKSDIFHRRVAVMSTDDQQVEPFSAAVNADARVNPSVRPEGGRNPDQPH